MDQPANQLRPREPRSTEYRRTVTSLTHGAFLIASL
jgi:hypothetical protein